MTPAEICEILRPYRYRTTCESELQRAVEKVLRDKGIAFQREVQLSKRDRPDFMVEGIVIELKVDGGANEVMRQLQRYATHMTVVGVVLVTTRSKHCSMPSTLAGKPVATLYISRF